VSVNTPPDYNTCCICFVQSSLTVLFLCQLYRRSGSKRTANQLIDSHSNQSRQKTKRTKPRDKSGQMKCRAVGTFCNWILHSFSYHIRSSCSVHLFQSYASLHKFSGSLHSGGHGNTVLKVLCYKSEGRWFDPSWCQWIFRWHKILPIALWPWGPLSL